jgi:hypothetical protein
VVARIPESLSDAVIDVVRRTATMPGPIAPKTVLATVGISGLVAESLAVPFQELARQFRPSAAIGRNQCSQLVAVVDAVNLVGQAAGFAAEQ